MDLPLELGPKMLACNERERRFVIEYLANKCRDAPDAARRAGYADCGPKSSAIRVRVFELKNRPRVQAALQEVARTHFGGLLAPAVAAAESIVRNPKHPDHGRMVLALLSAHGLEAKTRVDVNVSGTIEHRDADAVAERIRKALESLERLGRDPSNLLALRGPVGAAAAGSVIEGEVIAAEGPRPADDALAVVGREATHE